MREQIKNVAEEIEVLRDDALVIEYIRDPLTFSLRLRTRVAVANFICAVLLYFATNVHLKSRDNAKAVVLTQRDDLHHELRILKCVINDLQIVVNGYDKYNAETGFVLSAHLPIGGFNGLINQLLQ